MSASSLPNMQTRLDDFSYQVSIAADPRFWFRLERTGDRDVITDFFLGSFPEESAGDLLAECYRVLGLTPQLVIVFRDIVSSSGSPVDARVLFAAQHLYGDCGRDLLATVGARHVHGRLEEVDGKYHLELIGEFRV